MVHETGRVLNSRELEGRDSKNVKVAHILENFTVLYGRINKWNNN